MSKLIVRGGLPGKIRVEVEGGEGVDIGSELTLYQGLHELQPFIQALLDAANAPAPEAKKSLHPSKAPPKADA